MDTSILSRLQASIQTHQVQVQINELPTTKTNKLVLDVEHDESGNFVGCGLLFVPSYIVYYYSDIGILRNILDSSSFLIGHNIISDMELLKYWDCNVSDTQIMWDTMLIGHLLDSSLKDYSLKGMAKRELGIEYPTYDEIVGKRTTKQKNPRVTLDQQPLEIVSLYNAMDVFATAKLYEKQERLINANL